MKQALRQDLIALLVFDILQLAIFVFGDNQDWLVFVALNAFAIYLIIAHGIQTIISRARPVYNQKDRLYYIRTLGLWWGVAVICGLTGDGLLYVLRPSSRLDNHPFVGTALFTLCAIIFTVLYGFGEIISQRRRH